MNDPSFNIIYFSEHPMVAVDVHRDQYQLWIHAALSSWGGQFNLFYICMYFLTPFFVKILLTLFHWACDEVVDALRTSG